MIYFAKKIAKSALDSPTSALVTGSVLKFSELLQDIKRERT